MQNLLILTLHVLPTGSVLTSDVSNTVHTELDGGDQMICEESRVNVIAADSTAAVDGDNDG